MATGGHGTRALPGSLLTDSESPHAQQERAQFPFRSRDPREALPIHDMPLNVSRELKMGAIHSSVRLHYVRGINTSIQDNRTSRQLQNRRLQSGASGGVPKDQPAMNSNLAAINQWPFRRKTRRKSIVGELRVGRPGLVGHGSQIGGDSRADTYGPCSR